MSKFYYRYELPVDLQKIIAFLTSKFREEDILTFKFYYSSSGASEKTLDISGKAFTHLKDCPVESLEQLGFGKIEYTMTGGKWQEKKDQGLFTISKEMLDYSQYIEKPLYKQTKDRFVEEVRENEIPISIFISLAALIISILTYIWR